MVLNMSKSMTISEIEHQIKNLPQADQIMMLERIVHNLKMTLVNPDITHLPKAECKRLTEQLNRIYSVEESQLDCHFINAQIKSIDRDEW